MLTSKIDAQGWAKVRCESVYLQAPTSQFEMSDSESVVSNKEQGETFADLMAELIANQKKADALLKRIEKMAKKVKVKSGVKEKKPRKSSEGQVRWQQFQKFVWDELKGENAAAPYKEAMRAAGPRWSAGEPVSEEDKVAFREWLEAAGSGASAAETTASASEAETAAPAAKPKKAAAAATKPKKEKAAAAEAPAAAAAAEAPAAAAPAKRGRPAKK